MSESGKTKSRFTECIKRTAMVIASSAALVAVNVYSAVDVTWGLKRSDVGYSGSVYASTATGGTYTYTGNDGDANPANNINMTISGWATSGTNPSRGINNHSSSLVHWGGGLGLDRPNDGHAVDNRGHDEFIVFHFSEPVSLATYSFGWVDQDADSTLLAYDPNNDGFHSGSQTNATLGLQPSETVSDLLSNGWDAIAHYPGNGTAPQSIDTTNETSDIFSSYWIIGAYLSDITPQLSGGLYKKDAFKLASLGVMRRPPDEPPGGEAPIPSSAYLFLIGLAAFGRKLKTR